MSALMASPLAVVITDADNTLWDTDAVFAEAQLGLLRSIEQVLGRSTDTADRLAFVRSVDQALAESHHAKLRYPPRLLAQGIAFAFAGLPADAAARQAWTEGAASGLDQGAVEKAEQEFLQASHRIPALRPGVSSGMVRLRELGCLNLVLTEGNREKVMRIAQVHGLLPLIDRVFEARKTQKMYQRLLRLTRFPTIAVMVGDQLESDVRPAKEAGLLTIYFPGGFKPRWELSARDVEPDWQILNFEQVPMLVLNAVQNMESRATNVTNNQHG